MRRLVRWGVSLLAVGSSGEGECVYVVLVMGFAESGSRCYRVGRCIGGHTSVMQAFCCGGSDGAAWRPVDRGVLLRRVVLHCGPGVAPVCHVVGVQGFGLWVCRSVWLAV